MANSKFIFVLARRDIHGRDTDTSRIYSTKVRKNKQSADYNAYF